MVEATASTATSVSAPAESAGKTVTPATPALQLGPAPTQSPQRNRGIPEGAFGAFVVTTTALSAARFFSDETTRTMMDSRATHNFVDPFLPPWLKEFMSDYRVLNVPETMVGIGDHVLKRPCRLPRALSKAPLPVTVGTKGSFPLTLLWCLGWDPTYYLLLLQCRRGLRRYFTLTSPG